MMGMQKHPHHIRIKERGKNVSIIDNISDNASAC